MVGMSRSPSVVIAYLMVTQEMSLSESLTHVRGKRRIVQPNHGFLDQLRCYEEKLKQRVCLEGNLSQ